MFLGARRDGGQESNSCTFFSKREIVNKDKNLL